MDLETTIIRQSFKVQQHNFYFKNCYSIVITYLNRRFFSCLAVTGLLRKFVRISSKADLGKQQTIRQWEKIWYLHLCVSVFTCWPEVCHQGDYSWTGFWASELLYFEYALLAQFPALKERVKLVYWFSVISVFLSFFYKAFYKNTKWWGQNSIFHIIVLSRNTHFHLQS